MKLPPAALPSSDWSNQQIDRWGALVSKAEKLEAANGNGDAFESMLATLRNVVSTKKFEEFPKLLRRRIGARALTWLWLNDEVIGKQLLNQHLLSALTEAQKPRFTRITLQQLAQLYFRRFDELDKWDGVRALLEQVLLQQLKQMPPPRIESTWADPLVTLKHEGHWLLASNGPGQLAERVRQEGRELGETFTQMGLQGFDNGRYGDVCRAHFYLETLRHLPIGDPDPVLDELLKPSVAQAPFEGVRRIGHAALEILIDRAGQEPGEIWQNFIINLAGDPRITSSARNYREWWQPLGEARIEKVRGWLSKEDLRLFLQAVEQFGIDEKKDDLQRMFPARKLFLEGLFKQKLIRSTRLLLGGKAQQSVKRILGKEVKTSFARMDGSMNDKAVIYLDCGDFHIVEGSHSFKIWVYLTTPWKMLRSYEHEVFSHSDLTIATPRNYKKLYPTLPYGAFTHHPPLTWQNNVFAFLAEHGIALDIEEMLTAEDYQEQLQRFGIPSVNPMPTVIPAPLLAEEVSSTKAVEPRTRRAGTSGYGSTIDWPVPGSLKQTNVAKADVEIAPTPAVKTTSSASSGYQISDLSPFALKVLQYFQDNAGDRVRHATKVLGVEAKEINQVLYGPLRKLCFQDDEYGWRLTGAAIAAIDAYNYKKKWKQ